MSENLNNFINQIKKKGFVKIESFLTKAKIKQIIKIVNYNYQQQLKLKYRGVPSRDTKDKIVYNLQNKNYEYIKLVTNHKVLEIARFFLNDPYYRFIDNKKPNFNLLYFNARSSGNKLDLHIDSHIPFKGNLINMMQYVFLLEDSNVKNGCTSVVPGSHKSGKFTNRKSNKIIPLEGKAGDLIIWDSRLWHGAYANTTEFTRWALIATFGAWWVKPMMDITRSLPNSIYKKCTNVQKQILGFCSIPPKNEFERINTKTGYKDLKKNVNKYY